MLEVGDKVVCVNADNPSGPIASLAILLGGTLDLGLEEGRVYTVREVAIASGGFLMNGERAAGSVCLKLVEHQHPAGENFLFEQSRFRKVQDKKDKQGLEESITNVISGLRDDASDPRRIKAPAHAD